MRYRAGVERATTSGFHLGGKRWLAVVTFGLCGSYWQGGSSITHLWCCKSNRLSRPEWDREEIGLFPPASCSTLNIQLSNNSVKLVDGRWCHDADHSASHRPDSVFYIWLPNWKFHITRAAILHKFSVSLHAHSSCGAKRRRLHLISLLHHSILHDRWLTHLRVKHKNKNINPHLMMSVIMTTSTR